ncbi:MAG TPA: HAD family phosphatase [Acidimicrobiales bacterium]|nr:HAD family phosphatase [Acidimicrobiales bacterium]
MSIRPFDAVVFDLDGVIVDTEDSVFEAWCTVFRRHACELSLEDWNRTVGSAEGGRVVYELLCARASGAVAPREVLRAEIRDLQHDLFETMRPMAGVVEWVLEARALGLGLAVASSSFEEWVRRCLATVRLEQAFSSVHRPDERHAAKPAPDLYLAACRSLGVEPARAFAVEDSHNGLRAALAAGLRCVVVPNAITHGADFSEAHHRLSSLGELTLAEAMEILASSPLSSPLAWPHGDLAGDHLSAQHPYLLRGADRPQGP